MEMYKGYFAKIQRSWLSSNIFLFRLLIFIKKFMFLKKTGILYLGCPPKDPSPMVESKKMDMEQRWIMLTIAPEFISLSDTVVSQAQINH